MKINSDRECTEIVLMVRLTELLEQIEAIKKRLDFNQPIKFQIDSEGGINRLIEHRNELLEQEGQ